MTKEELEKQGIKIASKDSVWWMNVMAWFLSILGNKTFMEQFWTTVGETIYYPSKVMNPFDEIYDVLLQHECVHIAQYRKNKVFFTVAYIFLPIPFFFAYYRWKYEREAYMIQLRINSSPVAIEWVVNTLWNNYGWTWPRSWMKDWFEKELGLKRNEKSRTHLS